MTDKSVNILRDKLFSNFVIKNLHDILSDADKLQLRWGNQEILTCEGYLELEASLGNCTLANEILVSL